MLGMELFCERADRGVYAKCRGGCCGVSAAGLIQVVPNFVKIQTVVLETPNLILNLNSQFNLTMDSCSINLRKFYIPK